MVRATYHSFLSALRQFLLVHFTFQCNYLNNFLLVLLNSFLLTYHALLSFQIYVYSCKFTFTHLLLLQDCLYTWGKSLLQLLFSSTPNSCPHIVMLQDFYYVVSSYYTGKVRELIDILFPVNESNDVIMWRFQNHFWFCRFTEPLHFLSVAGARPVDNSSFKCF